MENEESKLMAYMRMAREGECSQVYSIEYLWNVHPTKTIRATVKTASIHVTDTIVTEKVYDVMPGGKDHKIELGCTGFYAGTSGHDTKHEREVIKAVFI